MLGTPVFVVAEFDGAGSVLAELTRVHPATTADAIADPPVELDGERVVPVVILVQGLPVGENQAMIEQMGKVGRANEVLSDDRAAGRLLVRMHIPLEGVPTKGLQVYNRFLGPIHNPWIHIDDGTFYIRGRVAHADQANDLARRMAFAFREAGVEAQVAVQAFDRHDLSVWEELVQATLGLSR